jgi:heme exporter protein B
VRLNATVFFALMTLLLFSFAVGPSSRLLSENAAGFIWLALFFASVLSLGESLRLETDDHALDSLRLLALPPAGIFLGKALVNAFYLFMLGVLMLPVAFALYDARLVLGLPPLLAVLALGAMGVSAPGTLYAAVALQARARDVLLPLLLFPVLVPSLLGAVKATSLVLAGDPMGQLSSWMALLGAFVVVYWVLCAVLFGRVIEE